MSNWFKPLRGKPDVRTIIGFDVEGSGAAGGFVCGAIAGYSIREFYTERGAMWERLLDLGSRGAWLFAHNLEYDLPIVAGDDWPTGRITFKTMGVLWAEYDVRNKTAKFYDSLNLFPRFRVVDLGKLLQLPKLKLDRGMLETLQNGYTWGGLSPAEQETVKAYNVRDAEIVQGAVSLMQDTCLAIGGELKGTIASVSMDIYRRTFHRWPWPIVPNDVNEDARSGFYGGRVENFAIGQIEHANLYDTNSLYPSVQRKTRYPHSAHLQKVLHPNSLAGFTNWEGVAKCEVSVPYSFVPPLPWRSQGRLFFPHGLLHGTWPIAELRNAHNYGVRVRSIEWVVGSSVTFNPFEDFIDTLWAMRQTFLAADDRRHAIVKLILNSLYGRFGLNPDNSLYVLTEVGKNIDWSKHRGSVTHDWNGRLLLLSPIENMRPPQYVNVLIAAQVSAEGRLHLHKELDVQGDDALYCDTDSILTTGSIATGDQLGQWREQMHDGTADLLGPKEYALHNAVLGDVAVVKGVPHSVSMDYFKNGVTRFERALRIRESMGQGRNPSEWVEVMRSRGEAVMKRLPVGDATLSPASQLTQPWAVAELRDYLSLASDRPSREVVLNPAPLRVARQARGKRINPQAP